MISTWFLLVSVFFEATAIEWTFCARFKENSLAATLELTTRLATTRLEKDNARCIIWLKGALLTRGDGGGSGNRGSSPPITLIEAPPDLHSL